MLRDFLGSLGQVDLPLKAIFSTWHREHLRRNSQKGFREHSLGKGTKDFTNLVGVFVIDKKALLLMDSWGSFG